MKSLRYIGGLWVCVLGLLALLPFIWRHSAHTPSPNTVTVDLTLYWVAWLILGVLLLVRPRLWGAMLLLLVTGPAAIFAGFQVVGWLGGYVAPPVMIGSVAVLAVWMLSVLWLVFLTAFARRTAA